MPQREPDASTLKLSRFLPPRAPAAGNGSGIPLQRFLQRPPKVRPGEVCELCGVPIPDHHQHVVSVDTRAVVCTCQACYLLFTHEGAGGGRYRAVPPDYLWAPGFRLTEQQWDGLQIPVGIVFFFHNSDLGRTVAFYPSPAGATESLLSLDAWDELVEANPFLRRLVPDVQAALIHRRREGDTRCFVVPIDACYELVGLIKLHWKGFDGGEEAWRQIDGFFESVRARSREVSAEAPVDG